VEALGFAATTSGNLVALHLYTAEGVILVHGPLDQFVAKCRGPRDANGRYFPRPAPEEVRDLPAWAVGPVSAQTPPAPPPAPLTPGEKRRLMTPERQARIEEAARRILANPGLRAAPVAREIGEPVHYLYVALGRLRRQERAPVAKPSGKIL
jgi:hypothetical protein